MDARTKKPARKRSAKKAATSRRKTSTELEAHVNAPGRAALVKEVRKKINALGIAYIYYQFVSVTGRIVGKGIPADHWEQIAERGFQLVYGSTANLFLDRHGHYIGYGPESAALPPTRPGIEQKGCLTGLMGACNGGYIQPAN